ncbi:MAG: hypothetical protein ABI253_15205 [Mycobacterium sp.]
MDVVHDGVPVGHQLFVDVVLVEQGGVVEPLQQVVTDRREIPSHAGI